MRNGDLSYGYSEALLNQYLVAKYLSLWLGSYSQVTITLEWYREHILGIHLVELSLLLICFVVVAGFNSLTYDLKNLDVSNYFNSC